MQKTVTMAALVVCLALPGAPLAAQTPLPVLPPLSNATVNLPWSSLQGVLERALAPERAVPPVAYLFGPAQAVCRAGARAAAIEIATEVTLTGSDWTLVPLLPVDSGLLEVLADGQPCALVVRDRQLCALLRKEGVHPLTLRLQVPVARSEGYRRVALALPAVPLAGLRAEIAEPGALVDVPRATALRVETQGEQTIASGGLSGGGPVELRWRLRPAAATARFEATTETAVALSDDAMELTLAADLAGTPVLPADVSVELPGGFELQAVEGPLVSGWHAVAHDGRQMLVMQLDGTDAPQATHIGVHLRAGGAVASGLVAVPLLHLAGAQREHGSVAVCASDGLVLEHAATADVTRVGVDELPGSLRKRAQAEPQLAYVYTHPPAALSVRVDRPALEQANVRADVQTLACVEPDRLTCQAAVDYSLARGGLLCFRIGLPDGAVLLSAAGDGLRGQHLAQADGRSVLTVDLAATAREHFTLTLRYTCALSGGTNAVAVPLVEVLDASATRGVLGIEAAGGSEVTPLVTGAARIDVTELPRALWTAAAVPPVLAFRYTGTGARVALQVGRHKQASVLVAMSDQCEAATTVAPDGKLITKLMYVVRNSQKAFMRLTLPEGAEVWSTFVADRPVTPVMNGARDLLIPLQRSKPVDPNDAEDGETYAARRDRRRRGGQQHQALAALREVDASEEIAADLKPYDVEVVFVGPAMTLASRGQIKLELPACDIPTGLLAWEVLLPKELRIYEPTAGNCTPVAAFSLPFTHFAEAQRELVQAAMADMAKAEQAQQKAAESVELAAGAKAAGVLPVRIETPVAGVPQRFEKLLVVDEAPSVTLPYKRR